MRTSLSLFISAISSITKKSCSTVFGAERLSARRRMDEELMLALRTAEGASLARLGARCGRDATRAYRNQLAELAQAGLATTDGSRVILTERGMALANEVAVRIMA
jgi:oxygen-independent coproporphyrinogen-3 oxidase